MVYQYYFYNHLKKSRIHRWVLDSPKHQRPSRPMHGRSLPPAGRVWCPVPSPWGATPRRRGHFFLGKSMGNMGKSMEHMGKSMEKSWGNPREIYGTYIKSMGKKVGLSFWKSSWDIERFFGRFVAMKIHHQIEINGNFRNQLNIYTYKKPAISISIRIYWKYLPYIRLHFRILKFPLIRLGVNIDVEPSWTRWSSEISWYDMFMIWSVRPQMFIIV